MRTSGYSQSSLRSHNAMHSKQAERKRIRSASVVSRLVTLLGLSVQKVCHPLTQWLLGRADIKPPKTKEAVNDAIAEEGIQVTEQLRGQLRDLKRSGTKLSLSADGCKFRRKNFIGVILHSSQTIPLVGSYQVHLGVLRLRKKADAQQLCNTIIGLLADFGLIIDDICGITTDGAAVMIKLGKLLQAKSTKPFFAMICLAHAIQLAVHDALKKDTNSDRDLDGEEESQAGSTCEDSDSENDGDDDNYDDGDEPMHEVGPGAKEMPSFVGRYGLLMTTVLGVCKEVTASSNTHDALLGLQLELH